MGSDKITRLAEYLVTHGFAGDIIINEGAKNWRSIKKLIHHEPFYTFGINGITASVKSKKINADLVREVLIEASGLDLARFKGKQGYFDPSKSAARLSEAFNALAVAAKAKQRIAFGTGHPGSMIGLLSELASWAQSKGARVVGLEKPLLVADRRDGRLALDMVGPVLVASETCSAWHNHDAIYMERFLQLDDQIDLFVGDHGFVGAAINHGIACIGFYDTDDPAMPLAEWLGLQVIAVPINDNRYNANSAALGRYLIRELA